jgi:hypothetical protein
MEAAASQLELLVHPKAHKTSDLAEAHLAESSEATKRPALAMAGAASRGKE